MRQGVGTGGSQATDGFELVITQALWACWGKSPDATMFRSRAFALHHSPAHRETTRPLAAQLTHAHVRWFTIPLLALF